MVKRIGRAGYTLVELMMTVAIMGIVSGIGAGMLTQVNRYFLMAKTRGDLQREARAAMYILSRELRQAQNASILIDRFSSSQPFYSQITFTKQTGTTMVFYQNGNQLIQQVGNTKSILTRNLLYMAFTFPRSDDTTIVSVSMTLQELLYQGRLKALHMASQRVQVEN